MSSQPDFDLSFTNEYHGEWLRIVGQLKVYGKEEATHLVSLLKSAQTKPLSVPPGTSILSAVTMMMENDYSQLPILEDERTARGMFSWRSLGKRMAMGLELKIVDDAVEDAEVLGLDESLFEAFASISRRDAVLIQDNKKGICGIITAYDVSETFGNLVEPFLLIEEVEKHVRALLEVHVSQEDLKKVRTFKPTGDGKPRISDLTFGGYISLLKDDQLWLKLAVNLDRAVFIQSLTDVKVIRNDVMHFKPLGIGAKKLAKLRNFAKFLREIRSLRKK